jgi:hypothetical protein
LLLCLALVCGLPPAPSTPAPPTTTSSCLLLLLLLLWLLLLLLLVGPLLLLLLGLPQQLVSQQVQLLVPQLHEQHNLVLQLLALLLYSSREHKGALCLCIWGGKGGELRHLQLSTTRLTRVSSE